jgi:5'-nucleotidase
MPIMKKLYLLFFALFSFTSQAKLLHIIHTNDLHSYFEGYDTGKGGYARLKLKLEELKAKSAEAGIPTLVVDGGDFGEGTSFFFSEAGATSIRALGVFGTEVSVVGNHDYLMGGNILSKQIKKANVPTKIISANLVQTPDMELTDVVKPFADFDKNGLKIRVIGLSTSEPHFQYAISPGWINDPIAIGNIEGNRARAEGKDLVIALTHIGTTFDKLLAQNSKDIDIIVGGHDHKRLDTAMMVPNLDKKLVPIVQAASHGMVIGSLLVDVKENHKVDIVEYKLHDIAYPMAEDQTMVALVEEAKVLRNDALDGRFDEVVGYSDIKLTGYEDGHAVLEKSCWGQHMAKMSADATKADIGMHLAFFEGMTIRPGPITYGNLVDNFPHARKPGDPGWEIATFETSGKNLKILLRAIATMKKQMGISFHGVDFDFVRMPDNLPYAGGLSFAWNFKLNGKRIDKFKKYKVAFPAEVGYAVKISLPKKAQDIFPKLDFTGQYYWPVMDAYMKKYSPIKCLSRDWKN